MTGCNTSFCVNSLQKSLSFLVLFFEFLFFFSLRGFPCFLVGINNPCFWGGFPLPFPIKNKGRTGLYVTQKLSGSFGPEKLFCPSPPLAQTSSQRLPRPPPLPTRIPPLPVFSITNSPHWPPPRMPPPFPPPSSRENTVGPTIIT